MFTFVDASVKFKLTLCMYFLQNSIISCQNRYAKNNKKIAHFQTSNKIYLYICVSNKHEYMNYDKY